MSTQETEFSNAEEVDRATTVVTTVAATLCGVIAALRTPTMIESSDLHTAEMVCLLIEVVESAKDKLNDLEPRLMIVSKRYKEIDELFEEQPPA